MTVIAVTREMGTLGKDVVAGVAERLGLEVVHHELVERQLAERLRTTESTVHRFLEGEASLWERWKIDSKKLSHFTAVDILELATHGNVLIRGWGAAQLLRDVPHVICVRVCAPMSKRVDEMKRRLKLDRADLAQREIERSDDAHARAVQRQFQTDWKDPTDYDLVINTGYGPIDCRVAITATCKERRL
jgi:cytidylate kinase